MVNSVGIVTIRPLKEEDAKTSYKWRNDKDVFELTTAVYDFEISYDMELLWIRRVIANMNDYRCAIEADGHYVGNIYLTGINGESAEYHIFIGDKDYWGKGVAKEASKQILSYAFNRLNLSFVYLHVKQENVKAIRLYQSLGMVKVDENNGIDKMVISRDEYQNAR